MKLYNTMTARVEEFKPVTEGSVRIYACGPTVYNYFHIGNSRVFIVFDAFRRYLKYRGLNVTFVQNITDIDDKIIKKGAEEGTSWDVIAKTYTDAYLEDIKKLKITPPDVSPRATEEIPKMLEIISGLIEKTHAYVSKHGVYFSVGSFEGYGKLSKKNIEELQQGARVEVDEEKKSPLDFALWKFSKPGEPFWDSPWGAGRPGWHIECSAMSSKYLDNTFDIHGGGADLIFPHHENEIAQSEAANGCVFANYWMHVGYMNIKGEKMSKSKGNFIFIRDILNDYTAEVIRMFILSAHYRGPLDFSYENIDSVKKGHDEIRFTLSELRQYISNPKEASEETFTGLFSSFEEEKAKSIARFNESLDDDFNTPKAVAVIYDAVSYVKKALSSKELAINGASRKLFEGYYGWINTLCAVLGVDPAVKELPDAIAEMVRQIDTLRDAKKYAESDELKKKLTEAGYAVKFRPLGTSVTADK